MLTLWFAGQCNWHAVRSVHMEFHAASVQHFLLIIMGRIQHCSIHPCCVWHSVPSGKSTFLIVWFVSFADGIFGAACWGLCFFVLFGDWFCNVTTLVTDVDLWHAKELFMLVGSMERSFSQAGLNPWYCWIFSLSEKYLYDRNLFWKLFISWDIFGCWSMTGVVTGLFVKRSCVLCLVLSYLTELNCCVSHQAGMWVSCLR